MKKKLFSLMMALALTFGGMVYAQVSLPYNEGFENGMGSWTMTDCNSSTGVSTSSSYIHAGSAAFTFHWTTTPPQYLISPEITGATGGLNVEFYYKAGSSGSYSETFQVGYSTSTNAVSAFTFGDEITAPAGADWATYTNTFPEGTTYVAVKCTSYDALYLCIDDFAFSAVGGGSGEMVEAELTVHDATTTNNYVPVYGTWADAYLKCEMVYPASELSAMAGGEISGITYYLSSPASDVWTGTWEVFMYEVDNTTIDNFYGEGRSIVYTGALDGTGATMTINFDTPYTYNGGNLLVGVYQIVPGNWKSAYFYGETVTGASVQGYSSTGLDYISASQRNFLPKTTFDYSIEAPDVNYITTVEINDFAVPTWGEPVAQEVTVPEDANYFVSDAGWFTLPHGILPGPGREINPDPIYNLTDRDYIWGFNLLPDEGYEFSPTFEAYINGSAENVLIAQVITPENVQDFDFPVGSAMVYTFAYYTYEEGLHTLSTYGVGDGEYESVDRLIIERPNGAWMEPYHFQLYNDGSEDLDVRLIDFLHNNGYFSMVEETEYPFTVAATGLPGVDLYLNTNMEWTDVEEINSLLAVNTNERSTHLYPIIAAPYMPYCPDVVEKAYPLGNLTQGIEWSMTTEEMWMEQNPQAEYELHNNYHMPFTEEPYNIPDGYDAVVKFTVDRAMMLNAWVSGENYGPREEAANAKVALYTEDFNGRPGPMADNNYTERPFDGQGGGGSSAASPFDVVIGNEESPSIFSYIPFYQYFYNSIGETLYTAEELSGSGVTRAPMTSLSWYATAVTGYPSEGIRIWMANVDDTELTTTSHLTSGMTLVYQGSMSPVVGWNEFVFNQSSFAWDGHSNLLICVNKNDTDYNSGLSWRSENAGFYASSYNYSDYTAYNMASSTYSVSRSQSRSIIKMTANGRANTSETILTENFESVTSDQALPAGWTTIDADGDGYNWYGLNVETIPGHSGYGIATSASYLSTPLYPDNYLVSPQVQLGGTISFWACNQDAYPETIGVAVSTTSNTNPSAFTTLSSWTIPMSRNGAYTEDTRSGNREQGAYIQYTIDLSAFAGQTGYVAIRHFNSVDQFRVNVDDIVITAPTSAPDDPEEPETPEGLEQFSAGPVIENLNILPGTYYLVASSTDRNYTVNINVEDLPCPEPSIAVYPPDNANGIEPNSVTLRWHLSPFCTEYRLIFGTTYYPEDEPNHPQTIITEWTDQLAEQYTVTNLWNNTNYFWRIEERTNGGEEFGGCTTEGHVFGFTTHLNVPQQLVAEPDEIFEGETTTLSWNSVVDRTYRYYFIYKDGVKIGQTPANQIGYNTFVVPAAELEYNMGGYVFNVAAVYDEGISDFSNDAIVKVSGYSNTTGINGYVYEQDGVTPIEGATITITGTDEFGNPHTYHATSGANGYYNVQVYVGHYTVALANKEGYQQAETVHTMPFDVDHLAQVDDVNFIMDEIFYAPAHVCAETMFVEGEEGDSLVHIWWDFDFYTALIEDFEDFENTPFEWTNSAQYPWTVTTTDPYEGVYCLKSGGAGVNNVISDMVATVDVPNDGFISFYVKPSCESGWDYGYFYIDGVEKGSFTGQGNWALKKYAVTAGTHSFRWSYQKDGSLNNYDDCLYIDYITFNEEPEPAVPGMTYDFEDSSMQGWTSIDADGDGYGWYVASEIMTTGYGHDGSNDCVLSQSYYGGTILYPDNYFVSPQVALGGTLKFYACGQDASYAAEHFGVAVSTTNNTSASAFTTIQEWTMSAKNGGDSGKRVENNSRSGRVQGTWYEYTVDLSAYAGQTGYVAIRHFNCHDMFYLDVDDITITDPNREMAGDRSLHHFRVYRTDCYNDGPYTSENTELLASAWMPDFTYFDVSWPYAEPGVYKYGVSAVYEGNRAEEDDEVVVYPALPRESEIVWSNLCGPCIDKDMYLDTVVTINVVMNSADSPEGTVVTFVNTNEGEQNLHPIDPIILDQTGYYVFPHFRKGNYNITIEHDGYFTIMDYQEIWSGIDLRYVMIEKIYNVRDLYVSRTGWAMWQPRGTISNPEDDPMAERHLEGYKILCESIDHEPIFNENTVNNFCQVATDQLVAGERYIVKVAAIYSTGMSDYEEVEWMYEPCDNYAGTVNGVTAEGNTITWEYPGGGVTPDPDPDPEPGNDVVVVLNVPSDIWGDGTGYQLLLDADHNTYGSTIPATGNFTAGTFAEFEYTIPENAECDTYTNTIVINGSQSITIPAGVYDYAFLNPYPGGTYYIASDYGQFPGRGDDYEFLAGKTYTFTLSVDNYDNITLVITDNEGRYEGFTCNKPITLANTYNRRNENFVAAEMRLSNAGSINGGGSGNFGDRDGWLTYDVLGEYYNAYGYNGETFAMGNLHPASQMAAYDGQSLTKVSFSPYCNVSGNIEIYQGGTDQPGTLVYSQAYSVNGMGETGDYIDIDLTTPVTIDGSQNLWVVVTGETYVDYPFSVVNSSAYDQYTFAYLDGYGWYGLSEVGGSGTWMLRAYVEEGTTPPAPQPAEGVLGAMIFVDGVWEAFVEYPTNTYTYEGEGENICVRIVYDGDAELPDNNFYYAMSCEECAVEAEMCAPGDDIYADVTATDQVHIWWGGEDRGLVEKIVKYNVYRSTDNMEYAIIGEVPASRSAYYEYFDNPGEGMFFYQVTAVYANGCESNPALSGIDHTVDYVVVGVTGLGELDANVNLFPNPTKSNVTIQAQGMRRITVMSVLGQVVFDTELNADEYTMNLGQFNAGMYLVRVYTENGMAVKRVTVMQ